jgi:hypothetical protein
LRRFISISVWVLFTAIAAAGAGAAEPSAAVAGLSAAQIADRNAQARGGLPAWRAVRTLSLSGTLQAAVIRPDEVLRRVDPKLAKIQEAGQSKESLEPKPMLLPMRVERKRPLMQRVEIDLDGKTSVQVFDGKHGWKIRSYLGRHEVEPFTGAELALAAAQPPEFEPPLIDYAAKGTKLKLEGSEKVDGRPAYNLKLTLKTGAVQHVWIDRETFLEVKLASARRINGTDKQVYTTLKEYKPEGGMAWPHFQETRIEAARDSEILRIDRVNINPNLDDNRFAKPL